ncbi:MAG: hypothetical protein ABSF28_25230 [Terracidiphilus sp.]|jgi:hypothetical protein
MDPGTFVLVLCYALPPWEAETSALPVTRPEPQKQRLAIAELL